MKINNFLRGGASFAFLLLLVFLFSARIFALNESKYEIKTDELGDKVVISKEEKLPGTIKATWKSRFTIHVIRNYIDGNNVATSEEYNLKLFDSPERYAKRAQNDHRYLTLTYTANSSEVNKCELEATTNHTLSPDGIINPEDPSNVSIVWPFGRSGIGSGMCNTTEGDLSNFPINNVSASRTTHVPVDEETIRYLYDDTILTKVSSNIYLQHPSGSDCGYFFKVKKVESQAETTGTFGVQKRVDGSGCKDDIVFPSGSLATNLTEEQLEDLSGGGALGSEPTCESTGGNLSWLLCSLLGYADSFVSYVDNQMVSLLIVSEDYYNNDDLKETWKNFRNLAYLILVPIGLVMVISTALGFEFISAYTVKKALPRLFMAVIFIAISFPLLSLLITITNELGTGILGFLTNSFGVDDITLSSLFSPGRVNTGIFTGALIAGGLTALAVGSIGILLSYALVTVIALLMGFVLLTVRQMLLILLLVIAPVAILSWIFPGNDKLWKLYWGSFSKLLLMFPMVILLVAAGRIFAAIVVTSGAEGPLETIVKLTAYIAPYFFIPATFKAAGGAFATITGAVNDRSRGLFDRQRKYRGEKGSQNLKDFKAGDKAFRPRSFNRLGERVGAGWKGRFGVGTAGQSARDINRRTNATEAQKNPLMTQLGFDDDGIAALGLSGGSERGARQRLKSMGWKKDRIERAVTTARQVGFNASNAAGAIDTMARNKNRSLLAGQAGSDLVRESLNEIHGYNTQAVENGMGSFAFNSRGAGRLDHGGEKAGNSLEAGWERGTVAQHAQSVGASLSTFADMHINDFRSGNENKRRAAAIALMEMQNMLPHATADNQNRINEALASVGVDHTAPLSVEKQLANLSQGVITAGEIKGRARVYDQHYPEGERGMEPGAPSGTPAPGSS